MKKDREALEEAQDEKGSLLLRILIVLLAIVIIAVGAFMFVYFACNVKKINIKGNNLYEDDVIKRAILDDEYSYNTLYVYLKYKFKILVIRLCLDHIHKVVNN